MNENITNRFEAFTTDELVEMILLFRNGRWTDLMEELVQAITRRGVDLRQVN